MEVPEKELKKINESLCVLDQRFDKIDQHFDKIDQRFDKIDSEFQILHRSLDKIAVDLSEYRIDCDRKHAELIAMLEIMMHRTNCLERLPVIEMELKAQGQRIAKLEANQK